MFWRRLLFVFLLGGMLMAQPVTNASAATPCNWAQFMLDVSVPDGSLVAPGAVFTKIWRLKNIGTCTWTDSYSLVFDSGSQMSGASPVSLPKPVAPGQSIDLSLILSAPTTPGHYRAFWKLRDGTGSSFGIGSAAAGAFWVDIEVQDTSTVAYDLVAFAPYANWKSGAGPLPFPGTSGDFRGYAQRLDGLTMEDGAFTTAPSLLTVPQNRYDGYIQGEYPEFSVQKGDRFQAALGCEGGSSCYVTYRLDYVNASGLARSFWTRREMNDGRAYQANIDLSGLAGQTVRFRLMVLATGPADRDRAIWVSPRIVRTNATPVPTIVPPGETPTPTPFTNPPPITPAACDKAEFVYDVTVPDGTYFAPGSAFSKTWRLKNTGTCTWSTSYRALFYSGERMSAPTVVNIPAAVARGQTVDLTVNMVAPQESGLHRGEWVLSNAEGVLFGTGSPAVKPFWLQINVSGGSAGSSGYDFAANACSAQWRNGSGSLPCPGSDGNAGGFVLPQAAPRLEDGTLATLPGLLVAPQYKYGGYIQGAYPAFTVQAGDRFKAMVGCEYNAKCYVTFRLDYMNAAGTVKTFWSWSERNEARFYNADVDLSPLAGQSVRFILTLSAAGYATGDRAIWGAPHIQHAVSPLPASATPAPIPTFPPPGEDWLSYTSQKYGFMFQYPPQAHIVDEMDNYVKMQLPFTPGTNLHEKYLEVLATQGASTCESPLGQSQTYETVTINGLSFLKQTASEGAMGSIYNWVAYSTRRADLCVSFTFVLHATNPGAYPTPPTLYDINAESAVFGQIVNTFVWLVPPGSPTPTDTPTVTPTLAQWLTYTSSKYSLRFNYPPQAQITEQMDNYLRMTLPITPGTNLLEKYLQLTMAENIEVCRSPLSGTLPPQVTETVVINGTTFLKETGMEGVTGQTYQWFAYSTSRAGTCVTFSFFLHSRHPGNYPTPPILFDEAAERAVFEQILATFTWLAATDTPTPVPSATDTPLEPPSSTPTLPSPGSDWLTYSNARFGFDLRYPKEGRVLGQLDSYIKIGLPITPGTTLVEKHLQAYVAENVSPCRSPLGYMLPVQTAENVIINGIPFLKETGKESVAGQIYEWIAYATPRGTACLSLNFILHSVGPASSQTQLPPFDAAAEKAVFEQIAATFKWHTSPVPSDTPTPSDTPVPSHTPTLTPSNPAPLPDLAISFVRVELEHTACLLPGDPIGVRVGVVNNGPVAAPAFTVRVGTLEQPVAGLAPGGSTTLFFNPGQLNQSSVTAIVDPASLVAESNESNNSGTGIVMTLTPPVPCSGTPTAQLSGPYGVILTGQNGLPIHSSASASSPEAGSFAADARDVMRTGQITEAEGISWAEVVKPTGGTGWVDFNYLTEVVTQSSFCADSRPPALISQLKQAVAGSNGSLFASLVSPKHGIRLNYWRSGMPVNYSSSTAHNVFSDPSSVNWGAGPSGTPDVGTFAQVVQPELAEVLSSDYQLVCDAPSYASMFVDPWPYLNIHYYAVVKPATPGVDLDWKIWLLGFEYVQGQPYLFGTVHYIWEP